jgi:hypothetical protein
MESFTDNGCKYAPVSRQVQVGGTEAAVTARKHLTKFVSSFMKYKNYAITFLHAKIIHVQVS